MSTMTLGLDLGPTSIGWALVDEEEGRIVATGVRVFPEGVDRDQQGAEHPKNEQRRIARGMRRQIARRARRKKALRAALVEAGLYPAEPAEQGRLDALDPYVLRRRALTEALVPFEFGRILIHLNQRRGFLSNRREDRKRRKETSELLNEISSLAASIEEAGHETLGQHFASIRAGNPRERVRGHHTRRDMYEREFDLLWDRQHVHHPQLLTDQLKYGDAGRQSFPKEPDPPARKGRSLLQRFGLHGIIFFQRPMYWPKSVIGRCELHPREKRCPRADRAAQRFRLLQEVNNLRILDTTTGEERALESHERALLIEYLRVAKERTFDQIRKMFSKKLDWPESIRFNLERGDRSKLLGMPTDAILSAKSLFGKAWHDRTEDEKNRIVRTLLHATEEVVRHRAVTEWGLSEEAAEELLDTDLEGKESKGYSSLCVTAIEQLLPHLERGLLLMTKDGTPSALSEAGYLRPDQRVINQCDWLPEPPEITNPIVRAALHEVRKVVNAIIREYGRPNRIRLELAREAKGSEATRARKTREMRENEARRDEAAERLREWHVPVTRESIERYLLWTEQHRECIYSGRPISQAQLFGGEVDVDHILPYSRSLDNSMMNRVLCFRRENAEKRDRTPHEWLAESNPAKYESILQRSNRLPYPKARRFRDREVSLDSFFARQFVDTTYITTQVHQYLECLGTEILCINGVHTAELRRHWGLNSVLRHDDLDLKNRDDHRHHAVDAIVVALTDRSRLQNLARVRRQGGTETTGEVLDEPWENFRTDVEAAVNAINVSHRPRRRVKGALHEETIYGPTSQSGEFAVRKPIESLTVSMIDDIRDESIRALVKSRVERFSERIKGQTIPKEVWQEPLKMKSGVPIKKVRLIRRDLTIQPIRGGSACVKPGRLHHACIFEYQDERAKIRRDAVYVTLLEAVRRKREGEPIISRVHPERPDAKFIMSLSPGDMLLAEFRGSVRPVIVSTLVSTQKRVHIVDARDARQSAQRDDEGKTPSSLKGRKIIVDPIGRIRWAND
ncbi:MAG: type II CRISPR RNA-guided endonuclease Cas9 [Phycisphaeraceae bacterium]|nr:MAG: type II CRISPR RNA-guided endonuclease Cas9 [Phycisphaeraceae bacterium]